MGSELNNLMTVEDVAEALRVHPETVRKWSIKGRFPRPIVQKHRFTRWSRNDVQKYIEDLTRNEMMEAAS